MKNESARVEFRSDAGGHIAVLIVSPGSQVACLGFPFSGTEHFALPSMPTKSSALDELIDSLDRRGRLTGPVLAAIALAARGNRE